MFDRTMKIACAALLASGCLTRAGLRNPNRPDDGRAARGRTHVAMDELRAEIDRYTCAAWSQEVNQWDITILGDSCVTTRDAKIGDAVRDVVQRVSVLLPLASVAYERFDGDATQPGLTPASADALARSSVWSDPVLTRAILLQIDRSAREYDWDCRDCTATEPPARLEVSWEEFLPYLFAYLWPVQTPEGPVNLFVCSVPMGSPICQRSSPCARKASWSPQHLSSMSRSLSRSSISGHDTTRGRPVRPMVWPRKFTHSCGRPQGDRMRVMPRRESSGLRASSCVIASVRRHEHRIPATSSGPVRSPRRVRPSVISRAAVARHGARRVSFHREHSAERSQHPATLSRPHHTVCTRAIRRKSAPKPRYAAPRD